jgi:prepilin-type processing-associated H-X9-DG protein
LAFVEQDALAKLAATLPYGPKGDGQDIVEANPPDNWEHAANGGIGSFIPGSVWLCPSAEPMSNLYADYTFENLAKGNYEANFGGDTYMSFLDQSKAGAFGVIHVPFNPPQSRWGFGKGTKLTEITDGTANTLLLSEIYGRDIAEDGRGVWIWPGMGGNVFSAKYPPNSPGTDVMGGCPGSWSGPAGDPLKCKQNRGNGNLWASPRSHHGGGVNVTMADGSVRFIVDGVDPVIWEALATRSGSEPPGDF